MCHCHGEVKFFFQRGFWTTFTGSRKEKHAHREVQRESAISNRVPEKSLRSTSTVKGKTSKETRIRYCGSTIFLELANQLAHFPKIVREAGRSQNVVKNILDRFTRDIPTFISRVGAYFDGSYVRNCFNFVESF